MGANIQSVLNIGSDGIVIDAECHLSNGLPVIIIVGLGGKAIDEAKERIRGAFASSHINLPRKRIIINLAPADIPKESTSLDLAIAAAILRASQQTKHKPEEKEAMIGELGLDGTIRPVRGIIGKLLIGKKRGIKTFVIPAGNLQQAQLVPSIKVIPVQNIREYYLGFSGQQELAVYHTGEGAIPPISDNAQQQRLSDIIGQTRAKRALEIAAAGGHNIFLNGPPGTGKSMLAKALPSLLPKLSQKEILEITHLHSLTDGEYDRLITVRPFRAPHHSASHVAIVGGGHNLRPGEISLSHRGVLFFDELPEFSRTAIEALRQPLEDRTVSVARAKETVLYPAHFILIATANPCPCGYWGTDRACECAAHHILRYRQKLSGPIMDRIDLHVNVEKVDHDKLLGSTRVHDAKDDDAVRDRIRAARKMQAERFGSWEQLNADMINNDIKTKSFITEDAQSILNEAAKRLNISARSYMRIVKVARTIADLAQTPAIDVAHITEALQYRVQNMRPV